MDYQKDCKGLYITDRYSYNTQNDSSAKRVYKIETNQDSHRDKTKKNYQLYHSYLGNNNYMNYITVSKNVKNKACQDDYLRDVRQFDK